MKLDLVIRELHRAETALHHDLTEMADRHRAEHEIRHVATDLAGWCQEHAAQLAKHGERFGLRLGDVTSTTDAPTGWTDPGLRLLADLRGLHRDTAGVSLDWELLAQAAQATKDPELVELSKQCHPQTLRQLKWSNAMLKTLSPQILST